MKYVNKSKNATKVKTEKFLNQHFYFKNVWSLKTALKKVECDKFLDIVFSSKSVFPYENIQNFHGLDLKPETLIFFNKDTQN